MLIRLTEVGLRCPTFKLLLLTLAARKVVVRIYNVECVVSDGIAVRKSYIILNTVVLLSKGPRLVAGIYVSLYI